MKLLLLNTPTGLKPLYDEDYEEKKKLKLNETYEVNITLARNLRFHRKFFALIKVGYDNTSLKIPIEAYRQYAIMKAGFAEVYVTPKGKMILPKSIAFNNMTEEEFQTVYSRVLDVIIEDTGADRELFEKELSTFI